MGLLSPKIRPTLRVLALALNLCLTSGTNAQDTHPPSGGHLSAAISTHFARRLYPAIDAADKETCRPDFAVPIYPGHVSLSEAEWDAKQGTKNLWFLIRRLPTNILP